MNQLTVKQSSRSEYNKEYYERAGKERQAERRAKNREAYNERRSEYDRTHPERTMWQSARTRSKKNGLPFDIEISDIVIPELCPVLGTPLVKGKGLSNPNSPSLDKIIPELGYVKGNICVISWRANSLKKDALIDEMEKVLDYMRKMGEGK